MDASYLEHCKNVLRTNGYVAIRKERRVILEANYVLPPYPEQMRIGKERLIDIVQREQERTFARKLFDDGLVVSTIRHIGDEVTGPEQVFTSAIAVIKPKP